MNWSSFTDFIEMGGHGLYVWGSYTMVVAAALWELAMLSHRRQRALDDAREQAALSVDAP